MGGFFLICLISMSAIFMTSLITYEILRIVWKKLPKMKFAPRLRVLLIVLPIFICHILSIWIYAIIFYLLEIYLDLGVLAGHDLVVQPALERFFDCLYFSAETYTSLGFGDVTPTRHLRMLAGAEVLNGLVMIGWTVSFTYLTMEKFWTLPHGRFKDS